MALIGQAVSEMKMFEIVDGDVRTYDGRTPGHGYPISSPIMKTSPCNEDPLTPHFYIVKLGFTGVYIFSYFCSKTLIVGTH